MSTECLGLFPKPRRGHTNGQWWAPKPCSNGAGLPSRLAAAEGHSHRFMSKPLPSCSGGKPVRSYHFFASPTMLRRVDADVLSRLVKLETLVDTALPTLATKADVRDGFASLETRHASDMASFEARLTGDLASLRISVASSEKTLTGDMATHRTDLGTDMASTRTDLSNRMTELTIDLTNRMTDLRTDLTNRMTELATGLTRQMAALETRLVRWTAGVGIATVTMTVSLMNFQFARLEARFPPPAAVAPAVAATVAPVTPAGALPANLSP